MTSNLASNEIADHALDLRKEQHAFKLKEDSRKNDSFYWQLNVFFFSI